MCVGITLAPTNELVDIIEINLDASSRAGKKFKVKNLTNVLTNLYLLIPGNAFNFDNDSILCGFFRKTGATL